jgi:hypothetical protein
MEPTEEDRRIDPDVQIIADGLPALMAARDACHRLGWLGEWHLCEGILLELAVLVEGETPPDSEAHRNAAVALGTDQEDILP